MQSNYPFTPGPTPHLSEDFRRKTMHSEPEVVRQLFKELLKSGDEALTDEFADALEDCYYFSVDQRGLCERYAANDIEVRLDFLVNSLDGNRSHYRAVVNNTTLHFGNEFRSIRVPEGCTGFRGERGQRQRMVFVEVRQLVEQPDLMDSAFGFVTLERLEESDALKGFGRNSVQFTEFDGLMEEVVLRKADREHCVACGFGAIGDRKLASEVVQRASEVVYGVADDGGEMERWLFEQLECEPCFAVAKIAVRPDGVQTRVKVRGGLLVEGFDVTVGPPQLLDDSG